MMEVMEKKRRNFPIKKQKKKKHFAPFKTSKKSEDKFKPVLFVKKPDDFSSNWKQLKDIITAKDRKQTLPKPFPTNIKGNRKRTFDKTLDDPECKIVACDTLHKRVQICPADIWFDDVDPILLENYCDDSEVRKDGEVTESHETEGQDSNNLDLVKQNLFDGVTSAIGIDCEMVGVGDGGKQSMLARVSIVNHFGYVLYDKFVKARETVTDFRTQVSGIRSHNLEQGEDFVVVQREVNDLLKGRILVGHAVGNDLKVLYLSHPGRLIRDTSRYKPFRRLFGGKTPGLKRLSDKVLGVHIQSGEHSSVQDAQASMRLYTLNRREWEAFLKSRRKQNTRKTTS